MEIQNSAQRSSAAAELATQKDVKAQAQKADEQKAQEAAAQMQQERQARAQKAQQGIDIQA